MLARTEVFLFASVLAVSLCYAKRDSLKGKHLLLLPAELPGAVKVLRNSTGHVTGTSGYASDAMDWLSQFLGFSYNLSDVLSTTFENTSASRGLKSYLLNKEVDLVLGAVALTEQRNKEVDFPYPWTFASYSLIIPYPETSVDMKAPWKPFGQEVWMILVVSVVCLTLLLVFTSRYSRHEQRSQNQFSSYFSSGEYLISVLLSQGGVCYPKRFRIRTIVAAWCLAAFVVTNIYNTVLISFLAMPNFEPLVNSIYDIPKVPGLRIVIDQGRAADAIFSEANSGILKELGDSLRNDPSLRCRKSEDCLAKVKSGKFVYVEAYTLQLIYVNMDLKKNGKCSLTIARDSFMTLPASFVLPKGSPYTHSLSLGVIRLMETGLPNRWREVHMKRPRQCLNFDHLKIEKPRLSLKNLTSTLVILLCGCGIATAAFIVELMLKWLSVCVKFKQHRNDEFIRNCNKKP